MAFHIDALDIFDDVDVFDDWDYRRLYPEIFELSAAADNGGG